jgi:putative SOS response-associated peptidase YedK
MCSRYFLDADGNIIAYTFSVPVHERLKKRYNIAPTQVSPVVRIAADGRREMAELRWGLVPFWAKDLAFGTKAINARSETAEEKPSFRNAFRKRRCVVPASGFFEWQGEPGKKQAYAITAEDQPLFGMAGLWESWNSPFGETIETYTILTTEANAQMAAIHDRMPVILPAAGVQSWLDGTPEEVRALMKTYAGPIVIRPIGKLVGNPRNDTPAVLAPLEPQAPGLIPADE